MSADKMESVSLMIAVTVFTPKSGRPKRVVGPQALRSYVPMLDHSRGHAGGSRVLASQLTEEGIGRATSLCFSRDGCSKLVLGDASLSELEETRSIIKREQPNAQVEIVNLDISDEASVDAFYARAVDNFGRVDFAANIADYEHAVQPVTALDEDDYEKSYTVNLRGIFLCQRAALRQMLKQESLPGLGRGSIVNVGSLSSTSPLGGLTLYSATKGGVLGLTITDAFDYGAKAIRLNMVAPGHTINPTLESADDKYVSKTALKRHGDPKDVGNAVAWLSSPRASYVTGITLTVDGGLHLTTGPP
ncbi:hypothetical protein A1O3_06861 [Capronia epimyces CBS 606.96]|uniref:3-oxoacyl-[acyl-carrier protein] reductase n=1 Tax=Capronia epimyces CBS 606.96 TaxID=1182542 RepID=W9YL96_9EURO|nr:uncharacterized protein A1O3_06861 [Capronia epimyces CBS 606.96]EXJ83044.1 hypothetical protein A1O3_06861 [Capronia epimyces CBS 606.96]